MTTPSNTSMPNLPPSTIVPQNNDLFIPYFNRTYEDISYTVNAKVNKYFPMAITSSATNIVNLPGFGSFLLMVSGVASTLPTLTVSLTKADSTASGAIVVLGSQAGTGAWAGNALTITSTATSFQIAHNRAGVSGNFNIQFIGTQG